MATRPPLLDVLRMGRAIKRGSAIEGPTPLVDVVREFVTLDTPSDSPLTLKTLSDREDYRDLSTPKLTVGDVAFDFELPRYDFTDGNAVSTGGTVQLSDFSGRQPVALIFGSYT